LAAAREAAGKARAKKEKGAGEGFDSELGATRQVRKKIKEKGTFDGRRDLLDEEGLERQRQYRRRAQMAAGSTAAPRKEKIVLQLPATRAMVCSCLLRKSLLFLSFFLSLSCYTWVLSMLFLHGRTPLPILLVQSSSI
jgi:hypothetical protein